MKLKRKFSQTRIIALGFITIIAIGTILLMLPFASKSGESAGFANSLFTAVSSSCVTGLVVLDTATSRSLFGQVVIICLIQTGGPVFMTTATMFSMLLKRKMGLREREIMVESINTEHIGGSPGSTAGGIKTTTLAVLATKKNGEIKPVITGERKFEADEHLLVLGREEDVRKVVK